MLFSIAFAGAPWSDFDLTIRQLVQPALEAERLHTVTVVAYSGKNVHLLALGRPSTLDTVYEIGSISKAFTGELLAEAVKREEVALTDPLSKHVPKLPKWAKLISLRHLATHTSGLPRNAPGLALQEKSGPYASWDDARLLASLSKVEPVPTGKMAYSNLGAALLGLALENASGKAYPELLAERVTGPLGLTHTDVDGAAPIQGYSSGGEPTPAWVLNAFDSTGGIHSTGRDMVTWLRAHGGGTGPLADSLATAIEPHYRSSETHLGLFWHRTPDGVVWHNGQTGGYHAIVAFSPKQDLGVVVLANTATDLVDSIGFAALQVISGLKPEPLALRNTLALPEHLLAVLAGSYGPVEVQHDHGALWLKLEGQPRYRMWASDPTHFYLLEAPVELELDQTKMVFRQQGLDAQTWPRSETPGSSTAPN